MFIPQCAPAEAVDPHFLPDIVLGWCGSYHRGQLTAVAQNIRHCIEIGSIDLTAQDVTSILVPATRHIYKITSDSDATTKATKKRTKNFKCCVLSGDSLWHRGPKARLQNIDCVFQGGITLRSKRTLIHTYKRTETRM